MDHLLGIWSLFKSNDLCDGPLVHILGCISWHDGTRKFFNEETKMCRRRKCGVRRRALIEHNSHAQTFRHSAQAFKIKIRVQIIHIRILYLFWATQQLQEKKHILKVFIRFQNVNNQQPYPTPVCWPISAMCLCRTIFYLRYMEHTCRGYTKYARMWIIKEN